MTIETIKQTSALVVAVSGRMDAVTAPEYEKKINELLDSGEVSYVVDFGQLEYISSAGLRALLSTTRRIRDKQGCILLANIVGNVKEVFEMSGFGSIFTVHATVDQALKMLPG
ncbi:MAG: STAS domain-containing protein [Chlorobiaceae bacterium]|nr:STAS domain-containing protein [Chlorobiaceae bacterium]